MFLGRMLFATLLILTDLFSQGYAETDATKNLEEKIAIVGAGVSGLSAAYQLQQLGYKNVTIFEKEGEPGGKVHSIFESTRMWEMGAIWVSVDYKFVLKLAEELKVTPPQDFDQKLFVVDDQGVRTPYFKWAKEKFGLFGLFKSIVNFKLWMFKHPAILEPGFVHIDKEFNQSLPFLAQKHGFTELSDMLQSFVVACGYGYYEEIPGIFYVKLLDWLLNMSLRQGLNETFGTHFFALKTFPDGFQEIWRRLSKRFDVRYNSPVTKIIRTQVGGQTKIVLTANDKTEVFDKLIVATALPVAQHFMDLDAKENALFSQVKSYRYLVTLFEADHFETNIVLFPLASRLQGSEGHVTVFGNYNVNQNIFLAYQIGAPEQDTKPFQDILIKEARFLGADFKKIVEQKEWIYFPHVNKASLDNGFFEDLNNLQGVKGTFYIGGIFAFESVEHNARFALKLVKDHF